MDLDHLARKGRLKRTKERVVVMPGPEHETVPSRCQAADRPLTGSPSNDVEDTPSNDVEDTPST